MFEAAELGRKISKGDYKKFEPELRQKLLQLQQALRGCDFPVIVLFAGVDGAGKGETINILNEWMDPRWLVTRAYSEPSQEEAERPEYWRYWRDLPQKGQIGFFLSSWYSRPILDKVYGEISGAEMDERIERITAFESALADDGALIIKFWMHLSKGSQKKRLRTLEKDPSLSWRVSETDWKHWRMYEKFTASAERAIMKTSTGKALWHIVEGEDERYRTITVGTILHDAIKKHIELRKNQKAVAQLSKKEAEKTADAEIPAKGQASAKEKGRVSLPTVLSTLDMDKKVGKGDYQSKMTKLQGRLNILQREAHASKVSTLVVMEGWDAAGKGGAIRRCTMALDARHSRVIPFAAPTDEERQHHYLWRFWRNLERAGRFTFFDRSWYGRVLVERVEGYATEEEWRRAYLEINDFEEQLVEFGIALVKVWIHITPEEQLKRFKLREGIPWKSWKLTDEDWRNREKWSAYEQAVNDMVTQTSTRHAPWTLIEGNDKRYARVKILQTVVDRMEKALNQKKKSL